MKISYGEYLAGDEGATFEFSRSFLNGTKFGVFASFTDVSSEDFEKELLTKEYFLTYQFMEISLITPGVLLLKILVQN